MSLHFDIDDRCFEYAVTGPGVVQRGNYLYQYYNSSGRLHDGAILRAEYEKLAPRLGGIGIIRQRLDRFVSADADHKGGWLETSLLKFSDNRLRLNIDTGAMGTVFVELRDAGGQPIPGLKYLRLIGRMSEFERRCGVTGRWNFPN